MLVNQIRAGVEPMQISIKRRLGLNVGSIRIGDLGLITDQISTYIMQNLIKV